jgi:hypothetical protein
MEVPDGSSDPLYVAAALRMEADELERAAEDAAVERELHKLGTTPAAVTTRLATKDNAKWRASVERWRADNDAQLLEVTAPLADALYTFVCRFVAFADEHQAIAVVLWVLHAWSFDAWSITPRLAVQSAEMGSGKTRLLEVLELVTPGAQRPANISPAALFRVIEAGTVTLLIDEVDTIFSPKASSSSEEVRGILNAGYRRGATVLRVEGDRKREVKAFPVFAPVVTAGIGTLPSTVQDRAIPIRLRKRAPHEHVEHFRFAVAARQGAALHDRAKDWADRTTTQLEHVEPTYLAELPDRQADSWTPLLVIADMAGPEWGSRARAAARALSRNVGDEDDMTIGVRLLADCRTVIGDDERIPTTKLLERLHGLEEAPWGDWYGRPLDARNLARKLRPYGIRSRDVRYGPGPDDKAKGYRREDFGDAWSRYLPPRSSEGDKGDKSDNSTVATQDLSPMSPMSPLSEGVDEDDPGSGLRIAQARAEAVRRRREETR